MRAPTTYIYRVWHTNFATAGMGKVAELRINEISEGQIASVERAFSESDVASFAALTGDCHPLHTDSGYCAECGHPGIVVHGMLTSSLASTLVGTALPGKRALLLQQAVRFLRPVIAGDTVRAELKVTKCHHATGLLVLEFKAYNVTRGHELCAEGSVQTKVREEPA